MCAAITLKTERMELVAITEALAEAELGDLSFLSRLLNARVPENWPPGGTDEESVRCSLRELQRDPAQIGWLCWYFVLLAGPEGNRVLIGKGGFGGKPEPEGTVNIGYSLVEQFRGHGYATEALRKLISWALTIPEVNLIVANVRQQQEESIGVLEGCGFVRSSGESEADTVCYEVSRASFVSG